MNTPSRLGGAPSDPAAPGGKPSLAVASAVYFALALLYFLPALLPGQHIYGTDYLVGGYFFHEFISERLGAGVLPKWVPHVYGGLPLFANPGSTYYPFRFLADALFPVSNIWPTLFVIQFTFAGIGMYLLVRELRGRAWVAMVAGLAFQFTGITMSWVLAGHEGRIIVATFAPLLFFFLYRGVRTARLAPFVGAAATVGFCLLSFQIQTAYYLLLGGAIWSVFAIWDTSAHRDGRRLAGVLALGLGAVAVGFLLAAVNFLPFLDYIEQSPRGGAGGRGYEYSVSWSMPVSEISAVAVPEAVGHLESYRGTNPMKLHTEYMGAVTLLLVALGFHYARRNRYFWFFAGLSVFTLLIAFGGNTPVYRLFYELLPGTKRFRAPSISFFLFSMSLVVMAAITLEALAARMDARRSAHRPARRSDGDADSTGGPALGIMAGVVVLGFLLGATATGGAAGPLAFRFALFATAAAALLWAWLTDRLRQTTFVALLSVLTVVDLWVVVRPFFQTVPPPEEMFAADDVADFLRSQPGRDRTWVLPFPAGATYRGQSGNYLMHFDVDQAGGEHGNQLQRWNEFVGAGEETYVDWHNFLQTPAFLNAGNIRYIVSGVPLDAVGLREVHRGAAGVVYENPDALPRAYLVPRVVHTTAEDGALALMQRPDFDPRALAVVNHSEAPRLPDGPLSGSARITSYQPDAVSVEVQASREALLVLADNFYQGWVARIDGQEKPILRTNHTLRGVVVPAGTHTVTFSYEPADLRTGFIIHVALMALLLLYAAFVAVRAWRSRRGPVPA